MFRLPDKITLWRAIARGTHGGSTWSAPEPYDSRNAKAAEKFTDINGDTVTSTDVSYTHAQMSDDEIRDGVAVLLGEHSTDPEPPREAKDVRARTNVPSARGTSALLRKLWFA